MLLVVVVVVVVVVGKVTVKIKRKWGVCTLRLVHSGLYIPWYVAVSGWLAVAAVVVVVVVVAVPGHE